MFHIVHRRIYFSCVCVLGCLSPSHKSQADGFAQSRKMSLSQYKHLFKAFYFGLLSQFPCCFRPFYWMRLPATCAPDPLAKRIPKHAQIPFLLPFFGAVCHTSDPNEGFFLILSFFEAMAGSMTNLLKKIASPFSLSSSYL